MEVTDKIQYYYDKCVQDNLARNGISIKEAMCDMVAAFARHCSLRGEAIDWGTYGTLQQDCRKLDQNYLLLSFNWTIQNLVVRC